MTGLIKVFVRLIKYGYMTVDEVPEKWRADVKAALAA